MRFSISSIIANGITWLMGLLGFENPSQAFALFITIIAVISIARRLLGVEERRRRKKREEDWLYKAQSRQEVRFQNSLPPLAAEKKEIKKTRKEKRIEKRNEKKGLSPTGWSFNEETQLWEPPEKLKK